jgi:hypothetical protein
MSPHASEIPVSQNIQIRKLIEKLNSSDAKKINLKINYYELPPEDEVIFKRHTIRAASTAMQFIFDPIWLRDKIQDWNNMNPREFLVDLLHYFHLEIEEAHYERIHHYFGPEEIIRTDMSKRPTLGARILRRLRKSFGLNLSQERE